MRNTTGDLIKLADQGKFDIIIHGCNCFCTMGGGIARKLANRWPAISHVDSKTTSGDKSKLGTFTTVVVGNRDYSKKITVINAYTQYATSSTKDVFEYEAFEKILNHLADTMPKKDDKIQIGLPKIGCGLAGGDETRIVELIKKFSNKVKDRATVTLVSYQ